MRSNMPRLKTAIGKLVTASRYLRDHQVAVLFAWTGILVTYRFLKYTYVLYGLPGTVATFMVMAPTALGTLMRNHLHRSAELSKADRRYLAERFFKSFSVLFVGLGLAVLMKKQGGPVEPVLLASVAALTEWALTAETAAIWLKYRRPELYGE